MEEKTPEKLTGIIIEKDSILLLYGGKLYYVIGDRCIEQRGWNSKPKDSVISTLKSSPDGSFNLCLHQGELRFWGDNKHGNSGLGDNYIKYIYYPTIIPCTNVKDFSCGDSHTVAVSNGDYVWVCGDNTYGQLGIEASKSPKMVISKLKLSKVSCWGNNTCGISGDSLIACGQDHQGIEKIEGLLDDVFSHSSWGVHYKAKDNKMRSSQIVYQFEPTLIVPGIYFLAAINHQGDLFVLSRSSGITIRECIIDHINDTILAYRNKLIIGNSKNYVIEEYNQ